MTINARHKCDATFPTATSPHCYIFFHILANTKSKHVTFTYDHSRYLVFEFTFDVTYFRRVIDIQSMSSNQCIKQSISFLVQLKRLSDTQYQLDLYTMHEPSHLDKIIIIFNTIQNGTMLTQVMIRVYKDSLISRYPPSINILSVMQFDINWLGSLMPSLMLIIDAMHSPISCQESC